MVGIFFPDVGIMSNLVMCLAWLEAMSQPKPGPARPSYWLCNGFGPAKGIGWPGLGHQAVA